MLINCPSCNSQYDCEPGKYECGCGTKFSVAADGSVSSGDSSSAASYDLQTVHFDVDQTIPPRQHSEAVSGIDATIPGKRDRKPDGRFVAGDLILGRYKVLSELGQGGMGVVYKCFDEVAGIEIALKALPPELSHNTQEMEDVKENFQLVHNLHHPNIASYNTLERDQTNGNYYLVMECVEGEDLRHWIRRKQKEGALTLDVVLPLIRQVATALDYAHKQKIIHRDIKPGNIRIDTGGNVKVLDFGLAAQIHTSMTRVSMAYHGTSGTAPYMAPEQWRGRAQGASADQYALAVMTYEMLAGHLPFENADAEVLRSAVLNETPEPVKGIPTYAQQALTRGMSKEPKERFNTCSAFSDAMEGTTSYSSKKNSTPRMALLKKRVFDFLHLAKDKIGIFFGNCHPGAKLKSFGILIAGRLLNCVRPIFKKYPTKEFAIPAVALIAAVAVSICAVVWSHKKVTDSSPQQLQSITLPGDVNLELVKVEAGSFMMSASDGENESDEVAHQATIKRDFYIGRTEVTQAQWRAVMGNNPSNFRGDDLPVEKVSWNDAMSYCEKLNSTGKAPSGWMFSLPTETQWEYAARGGKKGNGYKYSGSNNIDEVAWYGNNSGNKTHPVGKKKPNELGLYDMSGNVYEWGLDDWQVYSDKLTAEFTRGNDQNSSKRISRGGCWSFSDKYCRSAFRYFIAPNVQNSYYGFRVALVPAAEYGSTYEAKSANVAQQKQNSGQTASQSGTVSQPQAQNQTGDKTIVLPNGVKLELVKVEAGSFEMSAKDGENYDDEVAHRVTLTKAFYIGRTEVTQAQWKAVMGYNPSNFKGDDLPVEKVSWNDAMSFCEKLNSTGKVPYGWMFTLPTETQWEYAARGGKKSKGYKYSGSDNIGKVAWYGNNSDNKTHPVGKKMANELGLYDMCGNVWEWCLDDWNGDSSKQRAEFTRDNDQDGGSYRVFRGGSWGHNARYCRSAIRSFSGPSFSFQNSSYGFRLVLVQTK